MHSHRSTDTATPPPQDSHQFLLNLTIDAAHTLNEVFINAITRNRLLEEKREYQQIFEATFHLFDNELYLDSKNIELFREIWLKNSFASVSKHLHFEADKEKIFSSFASIHLHLARIAHHLAHQSDMQLIMPIVKCFEFFNNELSSFNTYIESLYRINILNFTKINDPSYSADYIDHMTNLHQKLLSAIDTINNHIYPIYANSISDLKLLAQYSPEASIHKAATHEMGKRKRRKITIVDIDDIHMTAQDIDIDTSPEIPTLLLPETPAETLNELSVEVTAANEEINHKTPQPISQNELNLLEAYLSLPGSTYRLGGTKTYVTVIGMDDDHPLKQKSIDENKLIPAPLSQHQQTQQTPTSQTAASRTPGYSARILATPIGAIAGAVLGFIIGLSLAPLSGGSSLLVSAACAATLASIFSITGFIIGKKVDAKTTATRKTDSSRIQQSSNKSIFEHLDIKVDRKIQNMKHAFNKAQIKPIHPKLFQNKSDHKRTTSYELSDFKRSPS